MRKLLFGVIAMFSVCFASFAQESVNDWKGINTLSGFGSAVINKYTPLKFNSGILYSHYVTDGLAVRGQFRLGYSNDKLDKDDKVFNTSNDFLLGLGIQQSLVKGRKCDGFVGVDALGGLSRDTSHADKDYYSDNHVQFGVRPFMGINFHFDTHFFVGLEWGYDVLFESSSDVSKVGGTKTDTKNYRTFAVAFDDLSSISLRIGYAF